MNQDFYISLLQKRLSEELSSFELEVLQKWEADPENRKLASEIEKIWSVNEPKELDFPIDLDKSFQGVLDKIDASDEIPVQEPTKVRRLNPYGNFWRVAAMLLIFSVVGYGIYQGTNKPNEWRAETTLKSIKEITLEDGTKVWLNKNSQLEFPESFEGDQRIVRLKGEGFFEVTKDVDRPFIVETTDIQTIVLGTAFNVKEETDRTTVHLDEGKVKVLSRGSGDFVMMNPQETVRFNKEDEELSLVKDLDGNGMAWKRKSLKFHDSSLDKALKDIARFFDAEISLRESTGAACPISGRYNTDSEIESLLRNVASVHGSSIEKINNNSFIVRGGNCN